MKRPFTFWILIFFVGAIALGGLSGAYGFLSDPSGVGIGMDNLISKLPFSNFTVYGVLLLVLMFGAPVVIIYGLLARPAWAWTDPFIGWTGQHWAWVGAMILGIGLAVWLVIQAILIGFAAPIQWFTAFLDIGVLATALLPGVRRSLLAMP